MAITRDGLYKIYYYIVVVKAGSLMQKEHSGDILHRSIYCSMLSRGEQNAVLWVDVKDLSTVGAILIKARMYFHFYLFTS